MKTMLIFLAVIFAGCSGCKKDDGVGPQPPDGKLQIEYGLVSSTMQLVHETVDSARYPSGWTRLTSELQARGQGFLTPLQGDYVNRFSTLEEFTAAAIEARTLVSFVPRIRVSIPWPCWDADAGFRGRMKTCIIRLQQAGWKIEVTLSHHDSYPGRLHRAGEIDSSGWAHEAARDAFVSYATSVVGELGGVLPPGTRVYLANEIISSVVNGYFDLEGKWPPGGKFGFDNTRNVIGTKKALIAIREAFRASSRLFERVGWRPALALNIRPGAEGTTIDYLFNWWLLDALVKGVNDDNFDGVPEPLSAGTSISVVGVTFYGTMSQTGLFVDFAPGVKVAVPSFNFAPNATAFEQALRTTWARYGSNVEVGAAEIGLSDPNVQTAARWLDDYLDVVSRLQGSVSLNSLIFILFLKAQNFRPGIGVFIW